MCAIWKKRAHTPQASTMTSGGPRATDTQCPFRSSCKWKRHLQASAAESSPRGMLLHLLHNKCDVPDVFRNTQKGTWQTPHICC